MSSIISAGGAYLVVNSDQVESWPGSEDGGAYDSIPFGADEGLVTELLDIQVIVLGLPDPLHYCIQTDGVVFATAVSCEEEDEQIPSLLDSVPDNWAEVGEFTVSAAGALVAFDSAELGSNATALGLKVELEPGTYAVQSQCFKPHDEIELQLLRLIAQS